LAALAHAESLEFCNSGQRAAIRLAPDRIGTIVELPAIGG
jgi:hypothetical protein